VRHSDAEIESIAETMLQDQDTLTQQGGPLQAAHELAKPLT
jgi:hypothetical protein